MAITAAGAALTVAHRRQQLGVRSSMLRQAITVWPAFDPANPETTWPPVEGALMPLIQLGRQVSSGVAVRYYEAFRAAEGIRGRATPVVADPAPDAQLLVSLRVTGLRRAAQLDAMGADDVAGGTFATLAGSLGRLVLNGGRDTLLRSTATDSQALGWARVSGGEPCSFCAMLAGRGPVYHDEDSAGFEAHDHCSCSAEPTYSRDAAWPGEAEQYRQLWDDTTAGLSGTDARSAFRQAFENR